MNKFESSIIETIHERKSVRSYSDTLVDPKVLQEVLSFATDNSVGPFGNKVSFQLVDAEGFDTKSMKNLGTYGAIKGARSYLVGSVSPADKAMEDFGFCMEHAMLKATSLGLGTCWLGGFLNRSTFAELCNIGSKEIIPAVTPLGFAAKRTTLRDKLIRKAVDGNNRRPFSTLFFEDDFTPLTYIETDSAHVLLESVRRAPSASNKQPWRIVISSEAMHLYLEEDAAYNHRFDPVLMQNIDMGIAMSHLALAAKAQSLQGKWTQLKVVSMHEKYQYIASWVRST